LAIPLVRDQDVVIETHFEWIVCRIAIITLEKNMSHVRLWPYQSCNREKRHAFPSHIGLAPGCDAMEIARVLELRQREELLPTQRSRMLDATMNLQLPDIERNIRAHTQIKHWKIVNLPLSGRQPIFRADRRTR